MAGDLLAQRQNVLRFGRLPEGILWILGKAGRVGKVQWRADRRDEAARTFSMFDQMCSHGHRAFLIGAYQPARRITCFDPAHAQVMLMPGPAAGWDDSDAAWSASIDEACGLLRNWFSGLLHKPAAVPPLQIWRQLHARRKAMALLLRVLSPQRRKSLRETDS